MSDMRRGWFLLVFVFAASVLQGAEPGKCGCESALTLCKAKADAKQQKSLSNCLERE